MLRLSVRFALSIATLSLPVAAAPPSQDALPSLPAEASTGVADDTAFEADGSPIESASDLGSDLDSGTAPKACTAAGYERWLKERAKAERVLVMQSSQFRLTLPIEEPLTDEQTELVRESMRALTLRLAELDDEAIAEEAATIRDRRIDLSLLSELRAVIREESTGDASSSASVEALRSFEQTLLSGRDGVASQETAPAAPQNATEDRAVEAATTPTADTVEEDDQRNVAAAGSDIAATAKDLDGSSRRSQSSESSEVPTATEDTESAAKDSAGSVRVTAKPEALIADPSVQDALADSETDDRSASREADGELRLKDRDETGAESSDKGTGAAESAVAKSGGSNQDAVVGNLERMLADLDSAAANASSESDAVRLDEQRSAIRRRLQAQRRFQDAANRSLESDEVPDNGQSKPETGNQVDDAFVPQSEAAGPRMPAADRPAASSSVKMPESGTGQLSEELPQVPKIDRRKPVDAKQTGDESTAGQSREDDTGKDSNDSPTAKRTNASAAKTAEKSQREATMRRAARDRNRARLNAERAKREAPKKADAEQDNPGRKDQEDGGKKSKSTQQVNEKAADKAETVPQPVKSHTSDCECDRCSAARDYREANAEADPTSGDDPKSDNSE